MGYIPLQEFRFWCQKVLPLVYDDSLSYYEVLCKLVDYLNQMIENQDNHECRMANLENDLKVVQKWIADYDTAFAESIIKEYLATMIFVEISDSGYIIYYIPENWKQITFNTTEYDIKIPLNPEYGHLVLSY